MWRKILVYLASFIRWKEEEKVPAPVPEPIVPEPENPVNPEPEPVKTTEDILLEEHNKYREKSGLNSLKMDTSLCNAAKSHAEWMSKNNRMSHIGQGGSTHVQRARKNGYESGLVAENIAMCSFCNEDGVTKMWIDSRGHRQNILGDFDDVGFARVGDYWCALFGKK